MNPPESYSVVNRYVRYVSELEDALSDVDEETSEFEEVLTEKLEEMFGVEFDVSQVNIRHEHNQVDVTVRPVGAGKRLQDEFSGVSVNTSGGFSFRFSF